MESNKIRSLFLDFFKQKEHKIYPSAPLLADDRTLLFTNAGMAQFKDFFIRAKRGSERIASVQKCLRTNDLEMVGKSGRHHTFFEMLGNFSFGDYFKQEACVWAWEFITRVVQISSGDLWITIHHDDKEAFGIWKKIGLPEKRIVFLKDNFWIMGDSGPCGPCSEIIIDRGKEYGCGKKTCGINCDCPRFLELWNLVFTQFNQLPGGERMSLGQKNIDTGMGLERIASILQGVETNFDTDLFRPLMNYLQRMVEEENVSLASVDSLRIIADHLRASTFLISEGLLPSNEAQGYVLRRLLRRAIIQAKIIKQGFFLYRIVPLVCLAMKEAYPELEEKREYIARTVLKEEEDFSSTLNQGLQRLQDLMQGQRKQGKKEISAQEIFRLYDTYGFPLELAREIIEQNGLSFDEKQFDRCLEEQRNRSRAFLKKEKAIIETPFLKKETTCQPVDESRRQALAGNHTATHLLQAGLRAILGTHVEQRGSLVSPDYLRFDFSHSLPLKKEEIEAVETWVNDKVRKNLKVEITETSYNEARNLGALAFFAEKYGDKVRLVSIGSPAISRELCAGMHTRLTAEIGLFKIVKEEGISRGIRRIEALTGQAALRFIGEEENLIGEIGQLLNQPRHNILKGLENILQQARQKEHQLKVLQMELIDWTIKDLLEKKEVIGETALVSGEIKMFDYQSLELACQQIRKKFSSAVIILSGIDNEKVQLIGRATKDLEKRIHLGKIMKEVGSLIEGGGGGSPLKAQAQGKNKEKIDDARQKACQLIKQALA